MSNRRYKKKESREGTPAWLTTYADLMSLLLTFFILLYSMSTVDAVKFKNITYSLQTVLTGLGNQSIIEGQNIGELLSMDENTEFNEMINSLAIRQGIVDMYEKVVEYVIEEELDANVSVSLNRRGVFVDIKEAILFEPGSAAIKESGLLVLKQLEGLINNFDNDIVIEGHTDNVPMKTVLHPSNWELSTARSVSVVRYLSETENIDPVRLSAIGYGEYRPIAPNDSSENRAINRRVNLLIIFDEEGGGLDATRD